MSELHPVRNAWIQGVPAVAVIRQRLPEGEFMTVQSAEEADRALGDPGNSHHCPLCNQFFGSVAFRAHAPGCIRANAPRWERQRDEEPPYAAQKRFGKRLIVPGHDTGGGGERAADAEETGPGERDAG